MSGAFKGEWRFSRLGFSEGPGVGHLFMCLFSRNKKRRNAR